jgi:uncharacterized protein (DUF924 family)
MPAAIDAIHAYWFGELDETGMADASRHALWFQSTAADDEHCRAQFGDLVQQALRGDLEDWAGTDRGLIALILLLDQFTRTIYRATPQAFAGDPAALSLAQHCIAHGRHQRLPAAHQVFLFLPLEHSEDLELQEECVALFEELAAVTGLPKLTDYTRFAVAHRDVIAQFGRFPHRNAILGRTSTDAELAYLKTHRGF